MLRRTVYGLTVVVVLMASSAVPLRAQPQIAWADPAGDATGLLGNSSTPRPSDAELDILEARFSFSGSSLVAWTRLERMGMSPGSQATAFRFHFRSGKDRYYLESVFATSGQYLDLFFDGGTPAMYRLTETGRERVECPCIGKFDFKKSFASFIVTKQSLARALNTPVGHLEIRDMSVETLAHHVLNYSSVDVAPAPAGAALRH